MPNEMSIPLPLEVDDIPYQWIRNELAFAGGLGQGARGRRVRLLQESLTLAGHNLRIDGIYGSGTATAVQRFQSELGLPVSGDVDLDTHMALVLPFLRALAPIDSRGMSYGELVIAYARQHLAEHPREVGGQNQGPWVRMYMRGMESLWCAAFVFFILNQAADQIGLSPPLDTTFSCDVLAARGRAAGLLLSEQELNEDPSLRQSITPGSIFLHRRTPNDWTHTGLVVHASDAIALASADHFDTIEGNTNDDGHREGYEACARIRGFADKDFVLVS